MVQFDHKRNFFFFKMRASVHSKVIFFYWHQNQTLQAEVIFSAAHVNKLNLFWNEVLLSEKTKIELFGQNDKK